MNNIYTLKQQQQQQQQQQTKTNNPNKKTKTKQKQTKTNKETNKLNNNNILTVSQWLPNNKFIARVISIFCKKK